METAVGFVFGVFSLIDYSVVIFGDFIKVSISSEPNFAIVDGFFAVPRVV